MTDRHGPAAARLLSAIVEATMKENQFGVSDGKHCRQCASTQTHAWKGNVGAALVNFGPAGGLCFFAEPR
jgi:hypothetical protein